MSACSSALAGEQLVAAGQRVAQLDTRPGDIAHDTHIGANAVCQGSKRPARSMSSTSILRVSLAGRPLRPSVAGAARGRAQPPRGRARWRMSADHPRSGVLLRLDKSDRHVGRHAAADGPSQSGHRPMKLVGGPHASLLTNSGLIGHRASTSRFPATAPPHDADLLGGQTRARHSPSFRNAATTRGCKPAR